MKKTKIFVDCHIFDQSLQGTSSYLKGLYNELIKDETKYFYFASHNYNLEQVFGKHNNVEYLNYSSTNKFYRLLFEIPQFIKKHKIDFAHFQYIVPPIKRCKYIVTIHDVLFLDFPNYFPTLYKIKNKFLFKISSKYADVVLTVSEYSKQQIKKHFNVQEITITPNAVDPIYFEDYNKNEVTEIVKNKFNVTNYFIYVSRWEPRKNHHTLLKTFVENKHYEKHNLVFVGVKAIENQEYQNYYNALPNEIKAKIFCFNKINFDDLLLIVRGAELSIYPSIAEGFGIPPLESIAAGIPTICSNSTAMSDYHFIDDCLFDPLSTSDCNLKILIGLQDKKVNQKKAFLQSNYSWELAAKQFQKAISTV